MREKKLAILGGGITGLTAAYDAVQNGYDVTIFEKSSMLGGLAVGFKGKNWEWPLERAYHHLFANDTDIINFAKEVGFEEIFFSTPKTDSLYKVGDAYKTFAVDTPGDFLRFPLLSTVSKLRGAIGLSLLRFFPHTRLYDRMTAEVFCRMIMGPELWSVFLEQLFRKKYGKYAGNILASFLWARIHKRTKELGYIKNGFQSFINYLEQKNIDIGVHIHKNTEIKEIRKHRGGFTINGKKYDSIVSTLPTPVLVKVAGNIFPKHYVTKLSGLKYLHARVLVLETDKPLLKGTYWLNICTDEIPLMLVAQHTNFVDRRHYGGNHIAYVGFYLDRDDPLIKLSEKDFSKSVQKSLKQFVRKPYSILNTYDFIGPFAQPIFDKEFLGSKPDFFTPIENFYIANLDMTFPYDRGTNYAVKLGREVVSLMIKDKS